MQQGHNAQLDKAGRDLIYQTRLLRRQAHSTASKLRGLKHNPIVQKLKSVASKEARLANIRVALARGKDISFVETQPKSQQKLEQYNVVIGKLQKEARKQNQKFLDKYVTE